MIIARKARRRQRQQLRRLHQQALTETENFFVYGSLMQRFANFNRFLRHRVKSIRPAYCQGYLYHLPIGFPGLVALENCQNLVAGELMRFKNPLRIIRALDQLEGYYPDGRRKNVYVRRKLPVIVEIDPEKSLVEECEAWVYCYPLDHLSPEHQKEFLINCGSWKMMQKTPRRPGAKVRGGRARVKALFQRLRRHPEPERVEIEPAFCMDGETHRQWLKSTACARFCRNPELCRHYRRKMVANFTRTGGEVLKPHQEGLEKSVAGTGEEDEEKIRR